jgi:Ni/Fe-hydrogenase subunit HybB-like protein
VTDYEPILRPVDRAGRAFWPVVGALLAVIALGASAYATQLRHGLLVTGLSRPVFWGMYILNLIFFIGISYGGTLTSAVLRLVGAEWRRPVARAAEAATVCALLVGAPQPLLDLGRVDRAGWLLLHGKFSSPMLWDVISISTYLLVSAVYLWVALIPDVALLRDRGLGGPLRRALYRALAAGFSGSEPQIRRAQHAMAVLAVLAIPVAVSAHTVLSWVPGLSQKPMWHSALMGPYFVLGAIFSGIATILILLAVLRRVLHLEAFLLREHFEKLGLLMLAMACLWAYFTLAEHLTAAYGQKPDELVVLKEKLVGRYAVPFWIMVGCCFMAPLLLAFRRLRTIACTVAVSALVVVGMWIERFLILIPTEVNPRLRHAPACYFPTWVEWSELGASAAAFVLLLVLFSRLFPVISIWELREDTPRPARGPHGPTEA